MFFNLLKLCKIKPFILDVFPSILAASRRLLGNLQERLALSEEDESRMRRRQVFRHTFSVIAVEREPVQGWLPCIEATPDSANGTAERICETHLTILSPMNVVFWSKCVNRRKGGTAQGDLGRTRMKCRCIVCRARLARIIPDGRSQMPNAW